MKTINVLLVMLLAITLSSAGCKREDKAGKGGNAVLKITPKHHNLDITDCVVYIKYNTSTPPSETAEGYDEQMAVVIEDGKPVATFSGLKNGKYYIYGYGFDADISQNVKGGIPYEITSQSTININVPVTEGD